jgi:hypothetical protein
MKAGGKQSGIIFQKTELFVNTTVRTPNLVNLNLILPIKSYSSFKLKSHIEHSFALLNQVRRKDISAIPVRL